METICEYLRGDNLAVHLGMKIEELAPGHAVVTMPITDMHKNGLASVHGGALFSLGDFCLGVASNAHGRVAVAINASISFCRPAFSGILTATAHETHLGERIAGYTIDITDESGALIAIMQGMVYRQKDTIESVVEKRRAADALTS